MIYYESHQQNNGIRTSKITEDEKEGPTVALTDSEYDKLMDLSRYENPETNTDHDFFEVRIEIRESTMDKFQDKGFKGSKEAKEVKSLLFDHPDKTTIFRPRIKRLRSNRDLNRVDGKGISWKQQKKLIEFANYLGFDWVALFGPELDSPPVVFEERLEKAKEFIERKESYPELLPVVNIKNDSGDLLNKLEYTADLEYDGIIANLSSVKTKSDRLSTIREFTEDSGEDKLVYGANMPRYSKYTKSEGEENEEIAASVRLGVPKFGIDIVGYENRTWGGGPEDIDEIKDTKVHIPGLGTYKEARNLEESNEDEEECYSPCCDGKHPSQMIDLSIHHENLYTRIWHHDIHSIYRSFKVLREALHIQKGEEFYSQRPEIDEFFINQGIPEKTL